MVWKARCSSGCREGTRLQKRSSPRCPTTPPTPSHPQHTSLAAGNRPEELPEQLLAAARLYRIDFDKAKPFPAKSLDDLGNGTGPSHDGEAHR